MLGALFEIVIIPHAKKPRLARGALAFPGNAFANLLAGAPYVLRQLATGQPSFSAISAFRSASGRAP